MQNYLKNGSIGILAIMTGIISFYIPFWVHSIDPKETITLAMAESIEITSEFMHAASSRAINSIKNPLNVFNLKPLQYLYINAPAFNLLPTTPPTKKLPTSDLKNSLDQTSAPSPTILPTILNTVSVPEQAVVNIFCSQKLVVNGKVTSQRRTITGSGVLIHRDGTVLTNAHVAQFPLLSETNPNVVCLARYGNPATGALGVKVSFISPQWIKEYGKYVNTDGAPQTGASDFALLKLNLNTLNQTQRNRLSPMRIQKGLPNQGETIYSLSYPANILGVKGVNFALPQQKESLQVNRLYSVGVVPIDIIETTASTAGQRGSSGGAIIDNNGDLIGTIVTIVNSTTPSKTLIRAITMEHIDFELTRLSNINLAKIAQYGDEEVTQVFNTKYREYLTSLLNNYLNSL